MHHRIMNPICSFIKQGVRINIILFEYCMQMKHKGNNEYITQNHRLLNMLHFYASNIPSTLFETLNKTEFTLIQIYT